MKQLIIKFIKKTATNELKDMFNRNFESDKKMLIRAKMQKLQSHINGKIGQEILNIIIDSLKS